MAISEWIQRVEQRLSGVPMQYQQRLHLPCVLTAWLAWGLTFSFNLMAIAGKASVFQRDHIFNSIYKGLSLSVVTEECYIYTLPITIICFAMQGAWLLFNTYKVLSHLIFMVCLESESFKETSCLHPYYMYLSYSAGLLLNMCHLFAVDIRQFFLSIVIFTMSVPFFIVFIAVSFQTLHKAKLLVEHQDKWNWQHMVEYYLGQNGVAALLSLLGVEAWQHLCIGFHTHLTMNPDIAGTILIVGVMTSAISYCLLENTYLGRRTIRIVTPWFVLTVVWMSSLFFNFHYNKGRTKPGNVIGILMPITMGMMIFLLIIKMTIIFEVKARQVKEKEVPIHEKGFEFMLPAGAATTHPQQQVKLPGSPIHQKASDDTKIVPRRRFDKHYDNENHSHLRQQFQTHHYFHCPYRQTNPALPMPTSILPSSGRDSTWHGRTTPETAAMSKKRVVQTRPVEVNTMHGNLEDCWSLDENTHIQVNPCRAKSREMSAKSILVQPIDRPKTAVNNFLK